MLEIFEHQPYIPVPMSVVLQQAIADAIDAWRGFLSLPDEVQDQFKLPEEDTLWADPGFRNKEGENKADKKRLYHYMQANESFLFIRGKAQLVYENEKAQRFFSAAQKVHRLVGEHLISQHLLLGMDPLLLQQQARFVTIRFLRYISQISGQEIGDRHFDFSGLTLHLFPNNGELEHFDGSRWVEFHKNETQAALFPGFQAWSATQGKVKPCIHRAMQWEKGERIALVAFCPFTFSSRFPKGVDQRKWCEENNLNWFLRSEGVGV